MRRCCPEAEEARDRQPQGVRPPRRRAARSAAQVCGRGGRLPQSARPSRLTASLGIPSLILAACGKHILQAFLAWAYSYTSISQQEGSPPPLATRRHETCTPAPCHYYGRQGGACRARRTRQLRGISRAATRRELQHRLPLAVQRAARLDRVVHESRRRRVAALDLWSGKGMCLCVRESMTSI